MDEKAAFYNGILEARKKVCEPGFTECTCPKKLCVWRGKCKECVALHRHGGDHIPACLHHILDDKIKEIARIAEMTVAKKESVPEELWMYVREKDGENNA